MADKNVLQKIFIISQFPVFLEWFGSRNIMSYSGWMALGSGYGAYLYLAGIIIFEFLLWKKDWMKAAGFSYLFLLAGMAVSFFTWPVFRIGEINPEFSYVMMSWGYPVAIAAVLIAWMVHITVVLKNPEELV